MNSLASYVFLTCIVFMAFTCLFSLRIRLELCWLCKLLAMVCRPPLRELKSLSSRVIDCTDGWFLVQLEDIFWSFRTEE